MISNRKIQILFPFLFAGFAIVIAGAGLSVWLQKDFICFFSVGLGIPSIVSLIALWWFSTGEFSDSPKSILAALVILVVKMLISGIVFIYYFYHYHENTGAALSVGFLFFALYTILEVVLGQKLSRG